MSVMNSTIAIINDNDQILVIETGRRYNIEYRTESDSKNPQADRNSGLARKGEGKRKRG